jgi:hypothetical protein
MIADSNPDGAPQTVALSLGSESIEFDEYNPDGNLSIPLLRTKSAQCADSIGIFRHPAD